MRPENNRRISESANRALSYPQALFLGAAIIFASAGGACAADWYTGDKTSEPDYAPSIVFDTSDSLTSRQTNFGAIALTAAIDGNFAQEGFRARVEGVAGAYDYFTTLPAAVPGALGEQKKIHATQEDAGVLGGYGWLSRNWSLALYAGMEVSNTTLNWNDPGNTTKGLHIGAKLAAEFYGNPTKNTMLGGYASFSTSADEYYTRFKAGYRIAGSIFAGPEFIALGNQFYSEYRAGIHLTGVTLGNLSLGVSGGASSNRVTGSGGYGIVDARLGF